MYDLYEALNRAHKMDEAAFSGGVAGDSNVSGGTVRGRGASTQPGKNNYLDRMKSKNPDIVDTMVIKVSDIKPGMITQAGQVKEAEARNHVSGVKKMYIMHTNGYDGFWGLDETMDVMVDPENKSKPFSGDYRALLKMGLKESYTEEPSIEEIQSRVPNYLANHPYSKDFDVEDICEEVAANLFDLDYHEMSGDASYEIFNIVSRYVDSDDDESMIEAVGSRNIIKESSVYDERSKRLSDSDLDDMIDMMSEFAAENPDNKKYSEYLNSLKAEKAARNKKAQYDNSRRAKRDNLGLDRKYPYYITLYNEYPIYEPAEGGYYYAGLAAEEAEGFDSFQEAAAAIDGVAKELNSNDYNFVKKSATEYRDAGDKYVGTGAVLCVENNKQFRSRERGRVPYC